MSDIIGVYCIHNTMSNKYYIGSSVNVIARMSAHQSLLKKGDHHNSALQLDFNLLGINCFNYELLCECGENELVEKEQFYIDIRKNVYNVRTSLIGSKSRSQIKRVSLMFHLDADSIEKLEREAIKQNRSVNNLIETVLMKELDLITTKE